MLSMSSGRPLDHGAGADYWPGRAAATTIVVARPAASLDDPMHALFTRLFGPMFAKEMIEISRRRRYVLLRVAFGLAILWMMYLGWDASGLMESQRATVADRTRMVADIYRNVALGQFVGVFLLVPLVLCNVIAGERQAGTLEQLFTTSMSDREIVLGKVGSQAALMLTVVASGIPAISFFYLIGGLSRDLVLGSQAAIIVAVLFASAVTVFFSTYAATGFSALVLTYLTLAAAQLVCFLTPTMGFYFAMAGEDAVNLVAATTPAPGTPPVPAPDRTPADADSLWPVALGIAATSALPLLVVLGLVWATIRRLRVAPQQFLMGREEIDAAEAPPPPAEEDAPETIVHKTGNLWGNLAVPFPEEPQWKENLLLVGILAAAFLGSSLLFLLAPKDATAVITRILAPIWSGAVLLTVAVAVTNPLFRIRPGFFDLLLGTLLSPRQIVQGSIAVSWPLLIRIYVVPVQLSAFWFLGNPVAIVFGAGVGIGFGLLTFLTGSLCSMISRGMIERVAPTALLALGSSVLPYVVPDMPLEATRLLPLFALAGAFLCWRWVLRERSGFSLGTLNLTVYMTLAGGAVGLPAAYGLQRPMAVIDAVSPIFWLGRVFAEPELNDSYDRIFWFAPLYVAVLALQLGWLLWFALRRFDYFVGRVAPR